MIKNKKRVIKILIVIVCVLAINVSAKSDGWIQKNGEYYYYRNNQLLEGFQEIDGKTYFFGIGSKRLLHGWQNYGGRFYADKKTGEIKQGWQQIGKEKYYIRDNYVLEGFQEIDGKTYFFGVGSNRMLRGWQNYGGRFHCDEVTGEIKQGWQHIGKEDYYVKNNYALEGFQEIDGKTYFFGIGSNRLLRGWQKYGGRFHCDEITGEIKQGWQHIGKEDYYVKNNYALEGFQEIDGKTYFFGIGSNRMLRGWQNYGGRFHCDEITGEIKQGWQHINNEDYYVKDNHTLEGFQEIDGKTYFFGIGSNRLLRGWQNYGGIFYADRTTGEIASEGWQEIDNNQYYVVNHRMVTDVNLIDGKKYYFDSKARLVKTSIRNGYKEIVIDENTHELVRFQTIPVYYNQYDGRWAEKKYGKKSFGSTGCAPTSMAMAFTSIKERQILPTEVADYLYWETNEYNKKDSGTSGMGIIYATQRFGIRTIPIKSREQLIQELSSGKIVFAAMANGRFATKNWNHAILIYDYKNDMAKTIASDPLDTNKNGLVSIDTIWNEKSNDPDDISGGAALYALY